MLYIIMEYACGGDLSGAIKRHIAAGTHFPEEKLWSFLIQMTQGLQHLHSRRILHRDAKFIFTKTGGDIGMCSSIDIRVDPNRDWRDQVHATR